jgi:Skp family chaperone for outer membrane proteins
MREMVIPALVLGALLAAPAGAQEPAKPAAKPEVRSPRIAILDIDRVWSESLLGKSFASQIEKQQGELTSVRTKKESELKKMTDDIQAAQDDLEKQQSVLSPDVIEKRTRDLNKRKRDAEDFITDGKAEVGRLQQQVQLQQQQLQSEFLQKVQPYIELVSKDKGIDILLHKQATFLNPSKDFDISQDVIVKVDDAERTKSAKGAAAPSPGPAKSPAATAGAKPPAPSGPTQPKPTGPTPAPSAKPQG